MRTRTIPKVEVCRYDNGECNLEFNGYIPNLDDLIVMRDSFDEFVKSATQEEIDKFNTEYEADQQKRWEKQADNLDRSLTKSTKGFIYIIKSQGKYKIGKTKHLKTRTYQYKTENPHQVKLVFSAEVDDYHQAEKDLHIRYEAKRHRGEWFNLHELDILDIKKMGWNTK